MSTLSVSFHGGTSAASVNTILAVQPNASPLPLLAPNDAGSLPALCELRGFFTDTGGTLYVVNAYKEFSNILTFSPPTSPATSYRFAGLFAAGSADGLAHPFCAALAADGHVYVSNQDLLGKATSTAITFYEGPAMAHPGRYKGVFADDFITLRGIATDGTYWYVADEGDSANKPAVWIYDLKGNRQSTSLAVDQPVHLLYDGTQYLYIGSEQDNAVYRYDTKSAAQPEKFIASSQAVPIDHTSGLALAGGTLYVASRKTRSVNQYPRSNPTSASVYVQGLADDPEFVLVL